jgi:hypothetical protein
MSVNPLGDTDQDHWKRAPHFQTSPVADMRLNERVALVVGAAGHLGRAISQALMIFAQHKRLTELEKRLNETQK